MEWGAARRGERCRPAVREDSESEENRATRKVGARVVSAAGETLSSAPALVRVTTDAPLVLRGGDRFVLRLPAPLRTIGGGTVIDPYASRRRLPEYGDDELHALGA